MKNRSFYLNASVNINVSVGVRVSVSVGVRVSVSVDVSVDLGTKLNEIKRFSSGWKAPKTKIFREQKILFPKKQIFFKN